MFKSLKIRTLTLAVAAAALLSVSGNAYAKVEGDTIVLGAAISKTGIYSTNGMHTRNGYDLAVERINSQGGVEVDGRKYQLKIIYYDDRSSPLQAAQLAKRLIQRDGIQFLLGPYSSGLTEAMAPIAEKHKVPMIEANGAARSLFTNGYRYLFGILTSADQYLAGFIDLLAAEAKAVGKNPNDMKLALAFENDSFSQDVRLGVVVAAVQHHMNIPIDNELPRDLDDMTDILEKVKAVKPDGLIISGHAKGALTAAGQIEQFRVDAPMIAMTHCDSAQIEEKVPAGAEYIMCPAQWHKDLTYRDDDDLFGTSNDFVIAFKVKYNYEPPYQAAQSAAAVQVWVNAFERAQSFDTEKLRDAIAATQMQTFYGNVKFNEAGQNIAKPMVMLQVLGGEYKLIGPPKWISTKAVLPVLPRPDWSAR